MSYIRVNINPNEGITETARELVAAFNYVRGGALILSDRILTTTVPEGKVEELRDALKEKCRVSVWPRPAKAAQRQSIFGNTR